MSEPSQELVVLIPRVRPRTVIVALTIGQAQGKVHLGFRDALHSVWAPFQNGCWEVRGSKPGSPVIAWEPRSRRWRGFAAGVAPRQLRVAASRERRLCLAIRWSVRQALRRLLRPGDASAAGLSWLRHVRA